MAQDLPANVKVLRLFGIEQAEVEKALRNAGDHSTVQVQTMHKGGETLVLMQGSEGDPAGCRAVFNRMTLRVKAACGVALYGEGNTSLSEATVAALQKQKKLFVCADETTGRLLDQRLDGVAGAESVYDFGAESCGHETIGVRIEKAAKPGTDPVQQAVARIRKAYKLSGADWAVSHVPVGNGEIWLLVGGKKGVWLRRIAATEKPALWLLDVLRRAALEQEQAAQTHWVRYGSELPAVEADALHPGWQPPAKPKKEDNEGWPVADPDEYEPEEKLPPTGGGRKALAALLIVLVLAAAAAALLWWYTGGDIASLWNGTGLPGSGPSNADLL